MLKTLITLLQLFGIGLSMGLAGPCLVACGPVIAAYVAGADRNFRANLTSAVSFYSGRTFAYILQGAIAGVSGALVRKFMDAALISRSRTFAGIITIVLGISLLFAGRRGCDHGAPCEDRDNSRRGKSLTGLFVLGLLIGLAPCGPLGALLLDIALMSRGMLEGAGYAFAFGAGTFLAGLIFIGVLAGALGKASAILKSPRADLIFRILCSLFMILVGAGMLL